MKISPTLQFVPEVVSGTCSRPLRWLYSQRAARGLFTPAEGAGITVAKVRGEGEAGQVRRGRRDDRAKGGPLLSVYYS